MSATRIPGNGVADISPEHDVVASGDVERADTSIVPRDQRPQHRLGWIPFKGPKIDTIEWAREEIRICNELLGRGRGAIGGDKSSGRAGISGPRPLSSADGGVDSSAGAAEGGKVSHVVGQVKSKIPGMGPKPEGEQKENPIGGDPFPVVTSDYPALGSAFITFNRQIAAHMAAQVLTHHAPYRMGSKHLEVAPDDVVWGNLSLNPYEQKVCLISARLLANANTCVDPNVTLLRSYRWLDSPVVYTWYDLHLRSYVAGLIFF